MPRAVIRPKSEESIDEKEVPLPIEPEKTPEELPVEEESVPEPPDDEDVNDDPVEPVSLETADPEEELWTDGPTVGQVLEWRTEFKKVYVTSLSLEQHLLWRVLRRSEYRTIMTDIEALNNSGQAGAAEIQMYQEEVITNTCLLFPKIEDFSEELAGLPSLLAQQIQEASGFVALDTRGL